MTTINNITSGTSSRQPADAVRDLVADAITESKISAALRKIGSTRAEMHDQACFGFANLAGRVARINNCSAPSVIESNPMAKAGFWTGVREALAA